MPGGNFPSELAAWLKGRPAARAHISRIHELIAGLLPAAEAEVIADKYARWKDGKVFAAAHPRKDGCLLQLHFPLPPAPPPAWPPLKPSEPSKRDDWAECYITDAQSADVLKALIEQALRHNGLTSAPAPEPAPVPAPEPRQGPLITAIEIENFKGIGDRVRVELKPITLLFGKNSSGKSTIVQALHYAREIFERCNLDCDTTMHGGGAVELGGFLNLLHKHDTSRKLRLRFDLDLSSTDLPQYFPESYEEYAPDTQPFNNLTVSQFVKSGWVEVAVEWSERDQRPQLTSYEVGLNGELIARIEASLDGKQIGISQIAFKHALLAEVGESVHDFELMFLENAVTVLADLVKEKKPLSASDVNLGLERTTSATALPLWGKLLALQRTSFKEVDYEAVDQFAVVMSQVLVGPGELLRNELRKFRYLGPIREVPPRNFQPVRTPDESRWANGLAAWDALYRNDGELIYGVSHWLDETLAAGYVLKLKQMKVLDRHSPLYLQLESGRAFDEEEDIKTVLGRLPARPQLVLIDLRSPGKDGQALEVFPQDVGVGISQVIPVIVAALDDQNGITAIEQPELHIHPSMQVGLGDLFIVEARQNQLFLLETHSEHLVLRLLRRIRETSAGELPDDARGCSLNPEQLNVYYVEPTAGGIKVHNLRVDNTGEFIDRWPADGFFEERAKELF